MLFGVREVSLRADEGMTSLSTIARRLVIGMRNGFRGWTFAVCVCSAVSLLGCDNRESSVSSIRRDPAVAGSSDTRSPLTADSIRRAFLSARSEAVDDVSNAILRSGFDKESLTYLEALWHADPVTTNGINKSFLASTPVQTYIANVLAQAASNGVLSTDTEPLLHALRQGLTFDNSSVRRAAIRGLEPFEVDADVDRIAAIAEGDDLPAARVAIGALGAMCGAYARATLDRLLRTSVSPVVKAEAASISQSSSAARSVRCDHKTS